MFPNFAVMMGMPQPSVGGSSDNESYRNQQKVEVPFGGGAMGSMKYHNEADDDDYIEPGDGDDHGRDDSRGDKLKKKPFKKDPKKLKKIMQKASKQMQKENQKKSLINKQNFFKTKMCSTLQMSGACTRGDKCVFAHSQSELKAAPNLKKTRLCQLYQMGRCNMGSSCSFAHGEEELRSTPDFYKTSLCNSFLRGSCALGSKCRYAHGESELRAPAFHAGPAPSDQNAIPNAMSGMSMMGFGGMNQGNFGGMPMMMQGAGQTPGWMGGNQQMMPIQQSSGFAVPAPVQPST